MQVRFLLAAPRRVRLDGQVLCLSSRRSRVRIPYTSPLYRRDLLKVIGRMGRDQSLRGKGLGEVLLMDALHKAWQASKLVSCWAVVVDAKEGARDFYLKNEFTAFATQPDRLFLLMKNIELMFE